MNIQIFGKSKCFETQKAQRYFKERKIPFQSIDLARFGMSKGEFTNIKAAVGGLDALMDTDCKEYQQLYIPYLAHKSDAEEKLLENPKLFRTPIVRNGKQATVGYHPEIWETWK